MRCPKWEGNFRGHWCKGPKRNTLSWSKFSILKDLVRRVGVPSLHFNCRVPPKHFRYTVPSWHFGCTVPPRHFGTLHQWWLKFLATIFYPFWGLRYQFVIFGCGAPKMGKKSWREIFGTLSVSKSKFEKVDVALCNYSAGMALCSSAECHPGTSHQMGQNGKF